MTISGRNFALIVVVLVAAVAAYVSWPYVGAEERVRALCAGLKPGMPLAALAQFAERNGMRVPSVQNGPDFLVEKKTFGRYGCRVEMANGALRKAEYHHAD